MREAGYTTNDHPVQSTGATRFHSVRRRLMVALTPVILGVVAMVAIGIGRTARMNAQPVIVGTDIALLSVLADQLERQDESPAKMLEAGLPPSPNTSIMLVRGGVIEATAGPVPEDAGETVQRSLEALGSRGRATVVRGVGPIRIWLTTVVRADSTRILILDRRISGVGTRFTTSVIAMTLAVLAIGLAVPAVIARGLYRPLIHRLETIENALTRYGGGRTDIRLAKDVDSRDEFDQVFEAFDSMANQIQALEQQRRDREESERELLADLAHDINTPVTVLRGWAETLLEHGDGMTAEELRGAHGELLGQSLYIQAIVEDLLTLASARSSRLEVAPVVVPLDPLFDSVVDGFSPMAEQRRVALVGDAGELEAWADPVRLRQIITNLVRNALLHAQGASVIELSAESRAKGVVVAVGDNGIGVPEPERTLLFERHRSGSRSDSTGWGLGLAIVAMLAGLHGGSCRHVALSPGSRFEVWFPPRTAAPADREEQSS